MYKVLVITTAYTESGVIPPHALEEQINHVRNFGVEVVLLVDPSQEILEGYLKKFCFDAVFSTTRNSYLYDNNSFYPADFDIFKIFEYYNAPFIGSGYTQQLIANDKILSCHKSGIAINNVLVTRRMYCSKDMDFHLLVSGLKAPYIVKPNTLSGSLGIDRNSVVFDILSLVNRVKSLFERFAYLNEILIEEYLEATTEYTVSVLGNGGELICSVSRLDYKELKDINIYSESDKQKQLKERSLSYRIEDDEAIRNELIFHAKRLFEHYQLRDFARFDLLYDNRAYFMEVNTLPVLWNSFSWEWQERYSIRNSNLLGLLLTVLHYRKISTGRPDNLPESLIQSLPEQITSIIDKTILLNNAPESSIPSAHCPKTHLYTMVDRISSETEVLLFLKSLVMLLKPSVILETGTYRGATTFAMAEGLRINKHGHIISLEKDSGLSDEISQKTTGYPITICNKSSLEYIPTTKIDLLFLDSTRSIRIEEFHHFRDSLHENSIIVWHDSSPEHASVFLGIEELYKQGVIDRVLLPTPRGLTIARLNEQQEELWTNTKSFT